MNKEERKLKEKVDEYFEKYMVVSFEKFLENWEEHQEFSEYQQREISRLNNIIDELEKWLKDVDVFQMNFIENKDHITPYKVILNKLNELRNK